MLYSLFEELFRNLSDAYTTRCDQCTLPHLLKTAILQIKESKATKYYFKFEEPSNHKSVVQPSNREKAVRFSFMLDYLLPSIQIRDAANALLTLAKNYQPKSCSFSK